VCDWTGDGTIVSFEAAREGPVGLCYTQWVDLFADEAGCCWDVFGGPDGYRVSIVLVHVRS
jgi:hypothetical protein